MLRALDVTNYRSIASARVPLSPFTILVGANGSGKSNLLRLLVDLCFQAPLTPHFNQPTSPSYVTIDAGSGPSRYIDGGFTNRMQPEELQRVRLFSIDATAIGGSERLVRDPEVQANGGGAVQVLDALKTGDREDLFDAIEAKLGELVPEIEKLSFTPGRQSKRLQVRERHIQPPVAVSELSEGTRLVLTILTILLQERKPSIICLQDLDRGLHPALLQKVAQLCRALVQAEGGPQIIATTRNPYLVLDFMEHGESVLVVDKKDGATTFTPLHQRLRGAASPVDHPALGGETGLVSDPEPQLPRLTEETPKVPGPA